MNEKKYSYVYQTKNLINGKLYIGVRCTNKLNDGYIGCGVTSQKNAMYRVKNKYNSPFVNAVVKYGYDNFKKEILCFFDTKEEAYEEETWLVDDKWVSRGDTYNVALGGMFQTSALVHHKSNKHYSYTSDIHVIRLSDGLHIGSFHTAMDVERELGFNHSKVCKVLNKKATKVKGHFFTRDLDNWKSDYEDRIKIVKDFQKLNIKKVQKPIYVKIKNESFEKVFNTLGECMEFLGLSSNGGSWFKNKVKRDGEYKGFKIWL